MGETNMNFLKIIIILSISLTTTGHLETIKGMLAKAELELYIEEKMTTINPRYKLHYHITPPVGWMNGPNGFSFFRGEFHLFYQFYPYDTQWGPLHWGHVASRDLVNWRRLPTALLPETEQCFSGSAVNNDGILALMYTGYEIKDEAPFYNESQYLAFSLDGIEFHKYKGNPVLIIPPFGTQDFRNPKIWKKDNYWYVVVGSMTVDHRGAALLYRSHNMITWDYVNVLAESNDVLGFMWESPDFFELNGKYILLISPQGMAPHRDRYKNNFQTGYIIGSFSYDNYVFDPEVSFQELDYGHDFYTTQTTEKDGKRYLVAWFGMWDASHPEDVDGWVGAMTLIRELDLVGKRVLMKPVDKISELRQDTILEGLFGRNSCLEFEKTAEIIVNVDLSDFIELDIRGESGGDKLTVRWDVEDGKVAVDRSGEIRQVGWEPFDAVIWRIFLDASSFELFCGEGEVVFSSRVYPVGGWRVRNMSPQSLHVVAYTLKEMMYT